MIGLTLVVSLGVFASSLKASFSDVLSDQTNADLFVTTSSASAPGFSPSVVDEVAAVDGVDEGALASAVHPERLVEGTEESTGALDLDVGVLVALRVDDEHRARPDEQVVDVRAPSGDAAVVQRVSQLGVDQEGEGLGHPLLAGGAHAPRVRALPPVGVEESVERPPEA